MLGVRPLSRALLKKREDDAQPRLAVGPAMAGEASVGATPTAVDAQGNSLPISIEMLESARGYDGRIGMVRGFTRDNPTRAALAVRDMIRSDAS